MARNNFVAEVTFKCLELKKWNFFNIDILKNDNFSGLVLIYGI